MSKSTVVAEQSCTALVSSNQISGRFIIISTPTKIARAESSCLNVGVAAYYLSLYKEFPIMNLSCELFDLMGAISSLLDIVIHDFPLPVLVIFVFVLF